MTELAGFPWGQVGPGVAAFVLVLAYLVRNKDKVGAAADGADVRTIDRQERHIIRLEDDRDARTILAAVHRGWDGRVIDEGRRRGWDVVATCGAPPHLTPHPSETVGSAHGGDSPGAADHA